MSEKRLTIAIKESFEDKPNESLDWTTDDTGEAPLESNNLPEISDNPDEPISDNPADPGFSGIVTLRMDDDNIDIDALADQLAEFARGYDSPAAAIANIHAFLQSIYTGNDYTRFTDIVRQNYLIISQPLADQCKKELEKAILSAL